MATKENQPLAPRKNPFPEPPAKRRKLSPPTNETQTTEDSSSQDVDMLTDEMPPLTQTQPSSQPYASSQTNGPKASQEPKQPTFADVLARLKEEGHEAQGKHIWSLPYLLRML